MKINTNTDWKLFLVTIILTITSAFKASRVRRGGGGPIPFCHFLYMIVIVGMPDTYRFHIYFVLKISLSSGKFSYD